MIESHKIILTKEEQERFVNSLLNPEPPNDKLKRTALAYKEKKGLFIQENESIFNGSEQEITDIS